MLIDSQYKLVQVVYLFGYTSRKNVSWKFQHAICSIFSYSELLEVHLFDSSTVFVSLFQTSTDSLENFCLSKRIELTAWLWLHPKKQTLCFQIQF